MDKTHYMALAVILKKRLDECDSGEGMMLQANIATITLMADIMEFLKEDNSDFSEKMFLEACGRGYLADALPFVRS